MNNDIKINNLLNQIIEYNVYQDLLEKDSKETGDSWNVHHLKLLKQLINENQEKKINFTASTQKMIIFCMEFFHSLKMAIVKQKNI